MELLAEKAACERVVVILRLTFWRRDGRKVSEIFFRGDPRAYLRLNREELGFFDSSGVSKHLNPLLQMNKPNVGGVL